jgi:hypothetical protein
MFAGFTAFTWFHTIITLIMLVAGAAVTIDMIGGKRLGGWMTIYWITGILTSVTGFGFLPIAKLLPSHILAIISLVMFAIALAARYAFHLSGAWRWIFAVMIVVTAYFDYFVLVTQIFLKVPAVHALAPLAPDVPQPPFAIAQGVVLVVFAILTILAAIKFKRETAA